MAATPVGLSMKICQVSASGFRSILNRIGVDDDCVEIIAAALRAPICQIAANAGVEGAVILDKVSKSKSVNYGYDAAHDTFGDMIENGIVDPTKVCRSALENAASVSSMVLTTESLVADLPEKAAPAAPAAPDMGGMY